MIRPMLGSRWLWLVLIVAQSTLHAADPVKDFTLPSARDSSLVRLSDHAGKVVLINWWRSSCGWCQRETPKLVELYQKHKDQGLVILGIADDNTGTVGQVPEYLRTHEITWPVGLNDQGEFMREIYPKAKGGGSTPTNYLVSRSGELTVLGLDRQPADWTKLEETIVRLLAEPAPTKPVILPRELPTAPDFSLLDVSGKTVNLKDFAGKPLVVNFFTSGTSDWAGAVVSNLQKDYDNRGLQVIGINLFDEDADIKACIKTHNIKYPILRGDAAIQKTWIGSNQAWAMFFVNSDGKIVKKITDAIGNGIEDPVFRKYADHLLEKPKRTEKAAGTDAAIETSPVSKPRTKSRRGSKGSEPPKDGGNSDGAAAKVDRSEALSAPARVGHDVGLPKNVPPLVGMAVASLPDQAALDGEWSIQLTLPLVRWQVVGEMIPKRSWPKLEANVAKETRKLVFDERSQLRESKVIDIRGNDVSRAEVLKQLKQETPVLVSVSGDMVDGYYLQLTKPDTLIIILGPRDGSPAPELLPSSKESSAQKTRDAKEGSKSSR